LFIEFIYTIPGVGEFFVRTASFHDFNALEASSAIFVITGLLFWVFNPGTASDGAAKPSVPIAWRSNRSLLVGVVLVGLVVLAGVLGPTLTPHDPIHFSGTQVEGPSSTHWLGTDRLGRDILSRILEGTRTALILASSVIVLGFLPGFAFAGIVRRYSSRVGQILDWSSSAWVAVGAFFWLLLFQLALYDNPGWIGLLVPMSIFAFMLGVRSTRIVERAGTPFITLLRNPEVHAAFICGAVTAAAAAVVAEVYLSYLGVTTLRNISLGTEMARAREFLPYDHWQLWSPAVVITIIVFSFLLIRTSLDDEVPPRTYER
jgi:peptide/nickel transport system permease protein